MNSQHTILGFLLAFLTGLFLLQFQGIVTPTLGWTIVLFCALIGIGLAVLYKKRTVGWTLVAVSIGLMAALLRAGVMQHEPMPGSVAALPDDTKMELRGWITEPPERRPTFTRYVVTVTALGEDETATDGKVLVTDRATWPAYDMGDEIIVTGTVSIPQKIESFDYAKYLSVKNIVRIVDRAIIRVPEEPRPLPLRLQLSPARLLSPLRDWLERRITLILPEPHASLLAGLITGSRIGLPPYLSEEFRIAGLTHIVAISGYNITIILTLLSSLLFFLPLKKRLLPLILGITAFVIFVGAGAPVVRSGIMGVIGLIAIQADRIAKPRQLILWSAFLMTLWNPRELWYDASFQLSFIATVGLAELGPLLKRALWWTPETLGVRESLAATIAAQIATLPITMLMFQQISLIAPLSNLLVAPLIPLTMLTGFIASLLGALYQPLGLLAGTVAWGLLSLILTIVHWSALIPFAAMKW